MGRNRNAQAIKPKRVEIMTEKNTKTQGKTSNPIINKPEMLNTGKKLLNTMTGALSDTTTLRHSTTALAKERCIRTELPAL
jgi:hypothetical protein